MNVYKLGTRWGKNAPDFYNLIRNEQISLSHINDCSPKKNEIILIARGFKIVAITLLQEDTRPVTDFPELEQKFIPFNIDYDQYVTFAKSSWYELITEDQFEYKTQDGICQVQKYEVIQIAKDLLLKYQSKEEMKKNSKLLYYKKQIILQGPPGTGKTRRAKEIALEMLGLNDTEELKNNKQFKLIQFHPSYTYEDFVRGIAAKPNLIGGGVLYEVENKTLGLFAKEALTNYLDSKKETTELSKEIQLKKYFDQFVESIEDELDKNQSVVLTDSVSITNIEEEAFRYKGKNGWTELGNRMTFKDILQSYQDGNIERQDVKKNFNISGLARQHASYFVRVLNLFKDFLKENNLQVDVNEYSDRITEKPFILIIDEINRANLSSVLGELIYALEYRGEAVKSMYDVDGKELILPPNLFIIGTMNTADRSVGHIDYAIRRRFAFVNVLPEKLDEDDKIYFNANGYEAVEKLFVKNLISSEFEINDVQIGHSYFIAKKDNAKNETERDAIFKMKMKYEIKPILREYLKDGIFRQDKMIDNLKIEDYIEQL